MKVFLTGGSGFIGSAVARRLRKRGVSVRALVQRPDEAHALCRIGCEVVIGDVRNPGDLLIDGCDRVIHGAALYRLGLPRSMRREMLQVNVLGTTNVLRAARQAGVDKVVYLSSVLVFGNTRGRVVDESHIQDEPHRSFYAHTKHLAHQIAVEFSRTGLPCVIVQPAAVYGPNDHSQVGHMIRRFVSGRLPFIPFPEAGFDFVHRDDVAEGIVLALEKAPTGEQYVFGGERSTAGEFVRTLAGIMGRNAPRGAVPSRLLRATAPLGSIVGPMMGFPPNLKELIESMDGFTVWASHRKATDELGYTFRSIEQGLKDTLHALRTVSC
ncbi:MAG: NAD-dependent epimerase/dehydratase family protein [Actinomycetota bacterium]